MGSIGRVLVLLALALVAVGLPLARADAALSPGYLAGLVVDDRHGHVFVTQFGSTVEVFDLDANPVGSIGGQTTAGAMLLDRNRLFVAQVRGDQVVEIDTRTLTERRRLTLGLDGACIESLGLARHRLFLGISCEGTCGCALGTLGGIAAVRRRGGPVTTFRNPAAFPFYGPMLATDPRVRNTLVAGDSGLSPAQLYRYEISRAGEPVPVAGMLVPGNAANLEDLALSPLGDDVFAACGAPYYLNSLRLADLSGHDTYPTGPYPNAVAVTRDGRYVAAGVNAPYDPDIYVYPVGSPTPLNSFELTPLSPQSPDLAPRGLAFDRTATRLYAVSQGYTGDPLVLHVLDMPLVPTTSTSTTSTTTSSTTTSTSPFACGGSFPTCGGPCAAGETCGPSVIGGHGICECAPDPACGLQGGVCGGGCPSGRTCEPIHTATCACVQ